MTPATARISAAAAATRRRDQRGQTSVAIVVTATTTRAEWPLGSTSADLAESLRMPVDHRPRGLDQGDRDGQRGQAEHGQPPAAAGQSHGRDYDLQRHHDVPPAQQGERQQEDHRVHAAMIPYARHRR